MDALKHFIFHNWQRKLLAIITAIIIWVLVNGSIIATKTISSIPIRIINLPADKTILGLLPNGFLSKRITLTITGTKDVVEALEPADLEVLLDATNKPNEWIVQISKKNLISLNPSIDLAHHVTDVNYVEFVIKLSSFVTEKIPITILPPIGEAPSGYQFLDILPSELHQTISGPEEQVLNLKNKGLELVFNLSKISKEQLTALASPHGGSYDDEIPFVVPDQWKRVVIPFMNNSNEQINDPLAKNLQIYFLRKDVHVIENNIPIRVYYPLKNSESINPKTYPLSIEPPVFIQNGIPYIKPPLHAYDVSKLFIDVVKNNLEITLVAAPKNEREVLEWGIEFIDMRGLENTFVAYQIGSHGNGGKSEHHLLKDREILFRNRFRSYMWAFMLFTSQEKKLDIESYLEDSKIVIKEIN